MRVAGLCGCALVCGLALISIQCASGPVSEAPHLRKQGTATQLIVDGKPFLALSGELLNSSATSVEYMRPIWPKLAAAGLNTVIAGVSWNQIEPQEGKFDFKELDGILRDARSSNLRLVLIWFASWKNGYSSYPPDWVKRDFQRFPRVQIQGGKTIELLSPLSDANRDADARAFAALMRHVKEVDRQHTVIMIQVENEVGVLLDSRDRSAAANSAFDGPVPNDLMDYLQQRKATLAPELLEVWKASGFKTSGTWEQVFGKGRPANIEIPVRVDAPPYKQADLDSFRQVRWAADEIFMAWHYARYVNAVAQAGKKEYNIPMYVNQWLQQPNYPWPGVYPSGGPSPQVHDVWRAGGTSIDILSPDLYLQYFADVCARFTRNGNPLFIPETEAGAEGAAKVLYAFGRHDAIGFSPFGIDGHRAPDANLSSSYDIVAQLAPLIVEHQGNGTMSAVLMSQDDPPQKVRLGNHTIEATFLFGPHPGVPVTRQERPLASAIFIATGPDEYYVAGKGVSLSFSPNTPGPEMDGLGTVEEGKFVNGRWTPGRQLAGDETIQGQYVSLWEKGIQRVTLYRYR
jgi:hypothetical protein